MASSGQIEYLDSVSDITAEDRLFWWKMPEVYVPPTSGNNKGAEDDDTSNGLSDAAEFGQPPQERMSDRAIAHDDQRGNASVCSCTHIGHDDELGVRFRRTNGGATVPSSKSGSRIVTSARRFGFPNTLGLSAASRAPSGAALSNPMANGRRR